MIIILVSIFMLLLVPITSSAQDSERKTRVGIVEFRVENDIGLENAGVIIPEWVASEFVRLGKYEVTERLSLQAVIEEQALGQTGIIDDATAARVGKLHGVEGIVTGSIMRIGTTISVTGRIIAVETGEVLKSSVVRASSLENLPGEIEILANQLCDISRAEFEITRDISKRRLTYLAIGGGLALAGSENAGSIGWVENEFFSMGIAATASFTTTPFSVWLQGVPIGEIKNILLGGSMDISQFWGIAAEAGFITDDKINSVFVNYYGLGVKIQPRHELALKVLFGGSSSGTLWLWEDDHSGGAKEEVDGFFQLIPPSTYSVEIVYRLFPKITILGKVFESALQDYKLKQHSDPLGKYYASRVFFLSIQKEFAIRY